MFTRRTGGGAHFKSRRFQRMAAGRMPGLSNADVAKAMLGLCNTLLVRRLARAEIPDMSLHFLIQIEGEHAFLRQL